MKKIFTLIAMAFVAISVNAQRLTFMGALQASYEKDGFKLEYVDTDGKLATDDSKSNNFGTADAYEKIEGCLKTGGKSGSKNNMTLTIPADGTLKVYVRTGSNSATDRNLVLTQNETELYNKVVQETDKVEVGDVSVYPIISVSVKAGTVAVTYPVGSLNFFAFELVSGGGGSATGETESYLAVKEDGSAASTEFANPTASGTDLIVNVATANVTLKAVASKTPARSQTAGMTEETWDKWNDANWDGPKKQNDIQFYWMQGSGNPYISFQSKTVINNDEPTGDYDPDYTYYQPDGSMGLPKSGEYIEVTAKVDGMFKIGFWANKGGSRKLYLIDKETKKALTWDADETKTQYKVEGYVNGWDEEWVETEGETKVKKAKKRFIPYMQVNNYVLGDPAAVNDKVLDAEFNPTTKVVDQVNNAVKFGWFVFDAKANNTYMIFGSDWQFGFQGYQFTPGATISDYHASDPTGIKAITTKTEKVWNADAPMYNLSGQKVDKSYKGIVIQNGRKFVNK